MASIRRGGVGGSSLFTITRGTGDDDALPPAVTTGTALCITAVNAFAFVAFDLAIISSIVAICARRPSSSTCTDWPFAATTLSRVETVRSNNSTRDSCF